MIKPDDIDKIKSAADILDVVGEFVSLKKRGGNYIGLCPFHNEKTPSFNVNPARGIFKCFGCGKGGDAITFLMEHEHFNYVEALRFLADKYGITIEEENLSQEEMKVQSEREALYDVSKFAAQYFIDTLWNNDQGKAIGLSYFHERDLTDATIKKWELGFSLADWDDFTQKALRNGYSNEILVTSGLTIHQEARNTFYDRFRERIIFPIHSEGGRILGFTGRILSSDKSKAKYVNSPESSIYHKSKTLFGIHLAKNAISKQGMCYLVEGNMDVITLSQNGIENVVASSGTSLTQEQIHLIKRYTQNITILYDGDKAGIKAAMRAIDLILEYDMQVRVVLFPDGEDPDSYARSHSRSELEEFLQKEQQNFILFKTQFLAKDADDPIKKSALIKEILSSIAVIPNRIDIEMYVRECSKILDISEETLFFELQKIMRTKLKKELSSPIAPKEQTSENPPIIAEEQAKESPQNSYLSPIPVAIEQAIVKILLEHGEKTTLQPVLGEKGQKEYREYNVAEFVIADLATDDIILNDPVCHTVYELYKDHFLRYRAIPPIDLFMRNEQKGVSDFVAKVLTTSENISSAWKEKRGISTSLPTDPSTINTATQETLLSLRLAILDFKIQKTDEAIKSASSEQEVDELLQEKQYLQQMRNVIASARHTSPILPIRLK